MEGPVTLPVLRKNFPFQHWSKRKIFRLKGTTVGSLPVSCFILLYHAFTSTVYSEQAMDDLPRIFSWVDCLTPSGPVDHIECVVVNSKVRVPSFTVVEQTFKDKLDPGVRD